MSLPVHNFINKIKDLLTWVETCADPCPCRACMTGMRPMQFQIPDRSWGPSCACPDVSMNYDEFCKWSSRPIAQPRWKRKRQCDRWIPEFFYHGRSGHSNKSNRCQTTNKTSSNIKYHWHYLVLQDIWLFLVQCKNSHVIFTLQMAAVKNCKA